MLVFGDEALSRRRFWLRNACFWRRDPYSSPLLGEKVSFLTTRLDLVTVFG
ncbi:hypothetical protein NST17_02205 [Caldifermentibacillus hisashii]|uniref:Uncharacterized protein n=1 Tax=Caldifermentibacillus hisashii TaxID=996558 RepID=A0ABU9JT90_9BACI